MTKQVSGEELLARRKQGLCITCGRNDPPIDVETGQRELQCTSCQRSAETEKTAKEKARKRSR